MSEYEYRVRWRRHGRVIDTYDKPFGTDRKLVKKQEPERTYSAIYQTVQGAMRKVESLLSTDRSKNHWVEEDGRNPFDFPDLIGEPTIERREVGEWEAA